MTSWTLNGKVIPYPNSFRIRKTEISRSDRTASGKLVKDVIATKRTFVFEYAEVTVAEKALFDAVWDGGAFVPFIYTEAGQVQTVTVWMNEPRYDGELVNPETWVNYTFELEEE